jgi:chromosome partitioning protein
MQTILIANPKGGSGKTTLATNIAGFLAAKRQRVVLADEDPQQTATQWLARRPALFPKIVGADRESERRVARETNAQWIVVDSPAGLHGEQLHDELRRADMMVVPVTPSVFDMDATERFLATIGQLKAVKGGALDVVLVAMRVDARTQSSLELAEFVASLDYPLAAQLRSTQVYVHCARDGASIFDLPRSRAELDWEQWRPLIGWIARLAPPLRAAA